MCIDLIFHPRFYMGLLWFPSILCFYLWHCFFALTHTTSSDFIISKFLFMTPLLELLSLPPEEMRTDRKRERETEQG